MNKAIQNDLDASIVKAVASQEYSGVVNSLWKHPTLKSEIINRVNSEIDEECSSVCSEKEPSILRKTKAKQLTEFSERKCEEELKTRAPTLYGCIRSVTTSSKKRRKIEKGSNNDEQNDAAPISLAAFILLKQRCPQMSAIAYRFSLGVLWHSGAKKQVLGNE